MQSIRYRLSALHVPSIYNGFTVRMICNEDLSPVFNKINNYSLATGYGRIANGSYNTFELNVSDINIPRAGRTVSAEQLVEYVFDLLHEAINKKPVERKQEVTASSRQHTVYQIPPEGQEIIHAAIIHHGWAAHVKPNTPPVCKRMASVLAA